MTRETELVVAVRAFLERSSSAALYVMKGALARYDSAPAQVEGEAVRLWVYDSTMGLYAIDKPNDVDLGRSRLPLCVVSFRLPPPSPAPVVEGTVET